MTEMITGVPENILRPEATQTELEDSEPTPGDLFTNVERNVYQLDEAGARVLDENEKPIVIGKEIDPDPWEFVKTKDSKLVLKKKVDEGTLFKTVSPVGLVRIHRADSGAEAAAARNVVERETSVDRAKVQGELGEEAVEDAIAPIEAPVSQEAMTPGEYLAKLTEGLSDTDKMELRSYAESHIAYREAQDDGRGEDSTYHQQQKGQSYRAMSQTAKDISGRYLAKYMQQ